MQDNNAIDHYMFVKCTVNVMLVGTATSGHDRAGTRKLSLEW